MSDFLANLVARSLGRGPIVRPLLAPLFGVPQYEHPRLASTEEPSKPEARRIEADPVTAERLASPDLSSVKSRSTMPILGIEGSQRSGSAEMTDSAHEVRAESPPTSTKVPREYKVESKTEPPATSEAVKQPLSLHPKPSEMSAQGLVRLGAPSTIAEHEPKTELLAAKSDQPSSSAGTPIPIRRLAALPESPSSQLSKPFNAGNLDSRAFQQEPVAASLLVPHSGSPALRPDQASNTHDAVRAPISVRVRPGLPPAPSPVQITPAPPTINVTIGRVEVRGVSAAQAPKRERERLPTLSLEDYLHRRSRGDP